jgi:hypothetical protein
VIKDRIVGPELTVTRQLTRQDIVVENASELFISIDDNPERRASVSQLMDLMTKPRRLLLRIRLINNRTQDAASVSSEIQIKIDIATEKELKRVDRSFQRFLTHDDANAEDIRRFSDDTDGVANEYRDGLVSYFLAVFQKDLSGVTRDPEALERALDMMARSAYLLDPYRDRRVGAAIANCANLNLNDFTKGRRSTGVAAVDLALTFFGDLISKDHEPAFPSRPADTQSRVRCRIDSQTYSLIETMFWLGQSTPGIDLTGELERLEEGSLTPPDRAKRAALVGEWARRSGAHEAVRRCALILHNDSVFEPVTERWGVS